MLFIFLVVGELSNRAAQGQAFCNMGFAQSQLGEFNKARDSFTHAVQAAKDSNDKRGLWQAYEGLAAVSFLVQDYDKAVEYYKLALSVLSTAGEVEIEHNNRIVSKLANALECQLVLTKKINGRLPPLRGNSVKSNATVTKERVGKSKRVGKTRSRQEHHQLIARGIDGDQTPTDESEESGSTESSSEEETRQKEQVTTDRQHRHRTITTEVQVHHEKMPLSEQREKKLTSTDSTEEEQVVKDKERKERKPRHSRKTRNTSLKEPLKSTQEENHYEQAVDDRMASPARSDHSDEMPRAHREAYLASVQASAGNRPEPNRTDERDGQSVQSRTCVIQ